MNLAQDFHLCHKFFSFHSSHSFNSNFLEIFKSITDDSLCKLTSDSKEIEVIIIKVDSCKPGREAGHNTQNHKFHVQEDLTQRTHQLQKKFLHM
jgi:hypothetical protein